MRALLTPEVAPMSGVVLFRPGNELLWLFRRGRVVIETPSEAIQHLPSGLIPEAHQPLTDDVSMQPLFMNERVIQRAGGLSSLMPGWNVNSNASGHTTNGTQRTLR